MMQALSARDLLLVWESGQGRRPVDRALLILGAAFPGVARAELRALTVGRRDELLLTVRERTFGGALSCSVRCPSCGDALQFSIDVEPLRSEPAAQGEVDVEKDGYRIRARLPTSDDLSAAVAAGDLVEARRHL